MFLKKCGCIIEVVRVLDDDGWWDEVVWFLKYVGKFEEVERYFIDL